MAAAPATAAREAIVRARTLPSCHATRYARAAGERTSRLGWFRGGFPAVDRPEAAGRRGVYSRAGAGLVGHDRGVNELKEQLRADLTDAMRSRDQVRLRTLRMALTSITNEEVSGSSVHELSDDDILKVLTREAKKRREAAEAFAAAGRDEQAA